MKLIQRFLLLMGVSIVAVLALPTNSAVAATYTVTKTADTSDGVCDSDCSLREAVVASWYNTPGEYDTIYVPAGTYLLEGGQLEIFDDTAIIGAGAATTIIDGVANYRAFQIYSGIEFILSGVTITNATQDVGGGIYNSGNLYLEDSVVSGNSAIFGSGGGIYSDGYLNIWNSVISGNSASEFGGGIYSNYYDLDINTSTVNGNSAIFGGGGVLVDYGGGTLRISGSLVSGNTTTNNQGGGIYSGRPSAINGSTISANTANGSGGVGGGMYANANTAITNTTFGDNNALGGGGLYNGFGSATITGSTFSGNSSVDGGGIAVNGTVTLNTTTMSGNWASLGGGIRNWGTLNITDSTLTGNFVFTSGADSGVGGAISSAAGTVNVTDSTISGNAADRQGGAIHLKGTNSAINGSTVDNNWLHSGGSIQDPYGGIGAGIYYEGGTHAVNNTNISGNIAKRGGGGIMLLPGSTLTVADSRINNNDGYQSGGGIYNIQSTLDVVRSSIYANSTGYIGGGINNEGGWVTISNSTISGNGTSSYGGGIMNLSGTVTLTNSTLNGNSATTGGGLYRWPGGGGNYVYLRNTIVANSPGGNCGGDPPFSNGYNLISDGSCVFPGGGIGDIIGAWPALGPLANNGGPTPTHALLDGSPAADGGGPGCPVIDQRGIARPQGLRCDIGAYEASDTDGDGVSDPADSNDDNDGLLDGYDSCPLAAEDYDSFQDTDGCPDPDNDGDGICDPGQISVSCTGSDSGKMCFDPAGTLTCPTIDCRNLAEDMDAFKDSDGCPEPDNDNDGYTDANDTCPGTDALAGPGGMLGSPQDLNHNGIRDGAEAALTTDDSVLTFEDYDGVLDADGCHDSPGDDFDGDGLTDEFEVFVLGTLAYNPDTDGDSHADGSDNCPRWANAAQNVPAWPIPANDADCDGFSSQREGIIGTDPTRQCPAGGTPDAWPVDFTKSGNVNIADVTAFKPVFLQTVPPGPARFDLNASGAINIADVTLMKPFFLRSCTP